jgi:hypothetical protein
LDIRLQARQLLVVIIFVEQLQLSLEYLNFWNVRLYFLALFVEVIELFSETGACLGKVAVLNLALDQLDLSHDVFVQVLNVHFHAHNFGQTELSSDHALVLVSLNLLDLSIDLSEHLLEWCWVINLGVVGLVVAFDSYGLARVGRVGQEEDHSHRDHVKN